MSWLDFREPVNTWTHLLWMLLAFPATWLLWRRSRGDRPKQLSMLVFGISLICCFAGSSLWHAVRVPYPELEFFAMLDYAGIYLLIAGTATPIVFTLLRDPLRRGMLVTMWGLAAAGIVLRVVRGETPPWVCTSLYLGMSWSLATSYPALVRAVSHRPLRPLVAGGVLYTVGAIIYVIHRMTRWPVLWPGLVGGHEIFHVFVMAGSAAHFWFILTRVVPFDRLAPRPESEVLPATLPIQEPSC